jgi:hypothetical protein
MSTKDKYAAQKKWHNNNKEKSQQIQFTSRLKNTYGITLEQYNDMLYKQNGCCAICQKHHIDNKRALCVDHCHDTSQVRGLLCDDCNLMLGKVKDDTKILKQAIIYLNHYKLK